MKLWIYFQLEKIKNFITALRVLYNYGPNVVLSNKEADLVSDLIIENWEVYKKSLSKEDYQSLQRAYNKLVRG